MLRVYRSFRQKTTRTPLIPIGSQFFLNLVGLTGQIRPGIQCTKRQMQLKFI